MEPNAVDPTETLRIAYAPGVVPDKWLRRHRDRFPQLRLEAFPDDNPLVAVRSGRADMCLAREPLVDENSCADLHRVELYDEAAGVAAEKEHPLAAFADGEVVSNAELADEMVLLPALAEGEPVDVAAVRDMLPVVATGAGIAFAPRPLLRQLAGRKVVHREHLEGSTTRIVLLWPKDSDDDIRQDFVGTVRGRTANSARNAVPAKSSRVKKPASKQAAETRRRRGQGAKGSFGKTRGRRGKRR
ncbi:LysR family transcriptional regulator substrate-binding protein [Corynebacterium ulceribovis]|uniref:LysR family transcriptional regulator substrate-binding protein n=1 Tax=Corynebacterium ulceribovis TaxID=487732 RepID=UPI00035FB040|nr:LysR family transcriptional regulator substrate-binding protein [Corynebacterium ulceribovis]